MSRFKSILVVLDRSERSRHVFAKACILARHLRARLELFICDAESAYALHHSYDQSGIHRTIEAIVLDHKRYLDGLRNATEAADLDIGINACCESPFYEGVVRAILALRPDLVIKARTVQGSDRQEWPGHNDWHLVRTCPVPLLLTHARPWSAMPKIAAFVDPGAHETPGLAATIVGTARALCSSVQGKLDLVHAEHAAHTDAPAHARAPALLAALAEALQLPAAQLHVISGEPAASLLQFAQRQRYDVIALGALTHTSDHINLVGTLTDTMMRSIDSDFLLLKPENFACPVQSASAA